MPNPFRFILGLVAGPLCRFLDWVDRSLEVWDDDEDFWEHDDYA